MPNTFFTNPSNSKDPQLQAALPTTSPESAHQTGESHDILEGGEGADTLDTGGELNDDTITPSIVPPC